MLKFLYSVVGIFSPIAALPYLSLTKRGRIRLFERLGFWSLPAGQYTWFHGASVGEINGLIPIINKLKKRSSDKILLTAVSASGLDMARDLVDECRLLPLDSPIWISNALTKDIKINRFIFGETELWPALSHFLYRRSVPQFLVNARMSAKSYKFFRRASNLFSQTLSNISSINCTDSISMERFISIGAPRNIIRPRSNTKFAIQPGYLREEEIQSVRASYFNSSDAPIILLASIRPGEEEVIFPLLKIYLDLQQLSLVVAPRHSEQFDNYASKLTDYKFSFNRYSQPSIAVANTLLLDTIGKLERFASAADLIFVGGTFKDFGGHNPLEGAAYGVPSVVGNFRPNIEDLVKELLSQKAILEARNKESLLKLLEDFFSNPKVFNDVGTNAASFIARSHEDLDSLVEDILNAS